jgi:hypothetical protein
MWMITGMCGPHTGQIRYYREWRNVIACLNRRLSAYPHENAVVYSDIDATQPVTEYGGRMWSVQANNHVAHSYKVEPIPFAD